MDLNFNGLTCVKSLYSNYFTKDAKEKFHQIYLTTVKLPYLTENDILNNFEHHGWFSKSNIFWVITVANSRISDNLKKQCKFGNLQPPPGIEPGGRIEVCDYSMSFVSATLYPSVLRE